MPTFILQHTFTEVVTAIWTFLSASIASRFYISKLILHIFEFKHKNYIFQGFFFSQNYKYCIFGPKVQFFFRFEFRWQNCKSCNFRILTQKIATFGKNFFKDNLRSISKLCNTLSHVYARAFRLQIFNLVQSRYFTYFNYQECVGFQPFVSTMKSILLKHFFLLHYNYSSIKLLNGFSQDTFYTHRILHKNISVTTLVHIFAR